MPVYTCRRCGTSYELTTETHECNAPLAHFAGVPIYDRKELERIWDRLLDGHRQKKEFEAILFPPLPDKGAFAQRLRAAKNDPEAFAILAHDLICPGSGVGRDDVRNMIREVMGEPAAEAVRRLPKAKMVAWIEANLDQIDPSPPT